MTDDIVEAAARAAWIAYRVNPDDDAAVADGEDEDYYFTTRKAIEEWEQNPDQCTHIGADGFRECARAAIAAARPLMLEEAAEVAIEAGSLYNARDEFSYGAAAAIEHAAQAIRALKDKP